MIRTYSELKNFHTLEERFRYLSLNGKVGIETFGFDRYLNQKFYNSYEWRKLRDEILIRDNGCELGLDEFPIRGRILIHHMNPIKEKDLIELTDYVTNPDYLICVSHDMHNAIHYGNDEILKRYFVVERRPNDTCPWKGCKDDREET